MRKHVLTIILVTALFVAAGVLMDLLGAEDGSRSAALPASLDAHYPPRAPQPVYRFQMIALGSAFTGVISDLLAGDTANAEAGFAAFKALYSDIAKLVPEWQNMYPGEPVAAAESALKAAIQAKDPGAYLGAVGKLEPVCGSCHHAYMPAVQHKYHWKDFGKIMVKDPASGQNLPYAHFMQALNLGFSGSWVDLGQGQQENAQKRFQEFNGTFQALKETCEDCHGTSERKYYVDAASQAMVEAYGRSLAVKPADAKKAQGAMMAIGNEICFKCHLVHIPAAYSKRD
jgi:cytochrome c556